MTFNFEKLNVYKDSLDYAQQVFELSSKWGAKYQYSIGDQLRRASLSIPPNIAEGSSRSKADFRRFLSISRGSCYECVPLTEIAHNQNLISTNTRDQWYNRCVTLAKMLSRLRNTI